MIKKCICLMRVSTEQQKLEGQKEIVISAAISDGYQLEEIAVVEGKESARKVSIVLSVKDYLLKNNINLVFLNPHKMSTMRKEKRLKMN